jgi:hypothetical protein
MSYTHTCTYTRIGNGPLKYYDRLLSVLLKFQVCGNILGNCPFVICSEGYDTNITRVEAGSNTYTVTLRVVRGDEMGLKKAAP